MRPIPSSLRAYTRDARDAFAHAPLEVLLGIAVAVCFSVALRQPHGELWWTRVVAGAVFALPLLFSLSVLRARGAIAARARWTGAAVVLAGAAAYAAFVFHPARTAEVWRMAMLAGAAVCAASLVPWVGAGIEGVRERLWSYNARLLVRIVVVGAYGAALYAALAGAVAAIGSLFELKTPDHLYADLAGAVFFALVPWVVVGGIPALIAPSAAAPDGRAPTLVRLLGRYLYALVLGIYLAILAAYTLKVLLTGALPRNLLSPIVLVAGLAGFLGALFLEPLYRDPQNRGVARLMRAFPLLLLPLLPLAMWAVWVRRAQYGWTEFRYLRLALLVALVVLVIAGSGRLLVRRRALWAAVPAVLGSALLLAAVGPWSASAVSRRSQQARLAAALAEAKLLSGPGGTLAVVFDTMRPPPAPRDTIAAPLYERMTSGVRYLYDSHGAQSLERLIPNAPRFAHSWQLVNALPVARGCEPRDSTQPGFLHLQAPNVIAGLPAGTLHAISAAAEVPGTTRAIPVPERGGERSSAEDSTLRVAVGRAAVTVRASGAAGEWRAEVEVPQLLARGEAAQRQTCEGVQRVGAAELSAAEARYPLRDAAGRERGVLVLRSAQLAWPADTARVPKRVGLSRVEGFVVVEQDE